MTRKIAGTDFLARTDYRSGDGSVHNITILTADGGVVGRVSLHSARLCRSRGYHEGPGAYSPSLPSWATLADAAMALSTVKVGA